MFLVFDLYENLYRPSWLKKNYFSGFKKKLKVVHIPYLMRKFSHLQGPKMVFCINQGFKINKIGHKMDQKSLKIDTKIPMFFAELGYLFPICGFFWRMWILGVSPHPPLLFRKNPQNSSWPFPLVLIRFLQHFWLILMKIWSCWYNRVFSVMNDHYPSANYMDYWTSLRHFDAIFVIQNSFINHFSNVEVVVRLLCHQVMNDPLNSMTIGLL